MSRRSHVRSDQSILFCQTLGSILSSKRKDLRMSLVQVCSKMPQGPSHMKKGTANYSFHPSTLCRIEQGKSDINMIDLHYLCKILGLSVADIFRKINKALSS